MSDQILEKLFESQAKVRILKLFLRNEKSKFTTQDVRTRTQLDPRSVVLTLEKLRDAGVLKAYTHFGRTSKVPLLRSSEIRKGVVQDKREKTYYINPHFIFVDEMRSLVLKSSPASKSRIFNRIKGIGRIKLLALSGIFLKPDRELSRTDLLVVGDDISEKKLNRFLKQLEAEAGCEIQYSVLNSDEFAYRRKMLDRFLRDIFDKPHEVLINKLGI